MKHLQKINLKTVDYGLKTVNDREFKIAVQEKQTNKQTQ